MITNTNRITKKQIRIEKNVYNKKQLKNDKKQGKK